MLCENIDIMIAESAKKAWAQGFEQSVKEGHTAMFKTAVTGGFGSIPAHIEAQIDAASFDQLVEWTKQLCVASSLDEVFGVN